MMKNENAIKQLERMKSDKTLTGDEYNAIVEGIKALENKPILCKECDHYYFADNREQQCYVCDYWGEDNPEPTGYCNHAVKKRENSK